MKQSDIADRLVLIEESLARLELAHAARVPTETIQQALDDLLAIYGLVAQLKEIYTTQRDELAALVALAGDLLAHDQTGVDERVAINQLLVQLRELGRAHVEGLYSLERALSWRAGDSERRKA